MLSPVSKTGPPWKGPVETIAAWMSGAKVGGNSGMAVSMGICVKNLSVLKANMRKIKNERVKEGKKTHRVKVRLRFLPSIVAEHCKRHRREYRKRSDDEQSDRPIRSVASIVIIDTRCQAEGIVICAEILQKIVSVCGRPRT